MKFFFPLSNPWSRDLISSSWEFTNGFQQVNHKEQALDNFLISWENEESGNFLRKWGKWVFYFLHQSSVLQKHISTSNPAALQELMPALPPAAPWLGCVSLTRVSISLQEEASWSPALLSLWGSLQKTGWRQDSSLLPQPAAWQEAMGTPLASWIPTCALPWKHGKKQPRVSRTFLYLFSWKGFLETLQWVFAIN